MDCQLYDDLFDTKSKTARHFWEDVQSVDRIQHQNKVDDDLNLNHDRRSEYDIDIWFFDASEPYVSHQQHKSYPEQYWIITMPFSSRASVVIGV